MHEYGERDVFIPQLSNICGSDNMFCLVSYCTLFWNRFEPYLLLILRAWGCPTAQGINFDSAVVDCLLACWLAGFTQCFPRLTVSSSQNAWHFPPHLSSGVFHWITSSWTSIPIIRRLHHELSACQLQLPRGSKTQWQGCLQTNWRKVGCAQSQVLPAHNCWESKWDGYIMIHPTRNPKMAYLSNPSESLGLSLYSICIYDIYIYTCLNFMSILFHYKCVYIYIWYMIYIYVLILCPYWFIINMYIYMIYDIYMS